MFHADANKISVRAKHIASQNEMQIDSTCDSESSAWDFVS